MTTAHVTEAVVRAQKEFDDDGWYHGALTIPLEAARHRRSGLHPTAAGTRRGEVPSRATIHRVLVAHDRSPRSPASAAAGAPQRAHGPEPGLADRRHRHRARRRHRATIVQVIDDHSRLDLACHAARSENSEDIWAALTGGFEVYGHRRACSPTTAPRSPANATARPSSRWNDRWPSWGSPPSCPRSGTRIPPERANAPTYPAALAGRTTRHAHPSPSSRPCSRPNGGATTPTTPEPGRRHPASTLSR